MQADKSILVQKNGIVLGAGKSIFRVSTTCGNTGYLLEIEIFTVNLLEFHCCFWTFCIIDR